MKCKNVLIPPFCILPTHTLQLFSKTLDLFLFSHLLTCANPTICWDATLLALIAFFKSNMPSQKSDKKGFLTREKIKRNMLDKKAALTREKIERNMLDKKAFLK